MSTNYAGIRCLLRAGILTVTIDRQDRLNALDTATMHELTNAFTRADRDDAVRVIVVTGSGRAFCAGGDLSPGERTFDPVDQRRATVAADHVETGGPLAMSIYRSRKPFIAAINGAAVGVGLTMTLPMDLRLVASGAKLGLPFVRRGIVPDAAATWFLSRVVGLGTALDWACSGRLFGPEEALGAGLVRSVHDEDELLPVAYDAAREIVRTTAPVAVAVTRQLILRMAASGAPMDAFELESRAIFDLGRSEDAREGVRAFLDKRDPAFPRRVSDGMPAFYPWWTRGEELNEVIGTHPPFDEGADA